MKLLVPPGVTAEVAALAVAETFEPCEIERTEPVSGWAAAAMAGARRQVPEGALALLTDAPLYIPGLDEIFGQAMPVWSTAC
ncbi:MAG: hypothetical protein ACYCW6_13515, partial [Candidatus Xenobia bacterium]